MITTFQRSLYKSAGYTWPEIAGFLIYTTTITYLYMEMDFSFLAMSPVPVTILATAVTLLLSFRNNSAYDRWWEARKTWGSIVNESRSFATQVMSLVTANDSVRNSSENFHAIHKEIIHRHLAYVHALRLQLRNETDFAEIRELLLPGDWVYINTAVNKCTQLNYLQAEALRTAKAKDQLSDYSFVALHENLKRLYDYQGAAERIKNTPFPKIYDFGTRLVMWAFLAILPFALLGTLGYATIFLSGIVSTVFIEVIRMVLIMQDPFKNKPNDIPMTAICRTIEIDLRQMLGELTIPVPLIAKNGILM